MKRCLLLLPLLALAAACGGTSDTNSPAAGTGTGAATGPAGAQQFLVHGNDRDQFVPATVTAHVGTLTLTLQNGGVPHNLTFDDPALTGIGTVTGASTKSTTLRFDKPGTYTFQCTIHPGMAGKVVVS